VLPSTLSRPPLGPPIGVVAGQLDPGPRPPGRAVAVSLRPQLPEPVGWLAAEAIDLLGEPRVLVVLGVAAAAGAVLVVCRRAGARRWRQNARVLAVRPPASVDVAGGEVLWRTLLGLHRPRLHRVLFGQPHVAVELCADADGPRLQVWVPGGVPPGLVEHALIAAWPGTRVDEHPATGPVPVEGVSTGGALILAGPDWFPLRGRHEVDPARPLIAALSGLGAGETACVQVQARPAARYRTRRARAAAARLRNPHRGGLGWAAWLNDLADLAAPGGPTRRGNNRGPSGGGWVDPWLADDLRAVKDKTAQPLWEVGLRYAIAAPAGTDRARLRGVADGIASAFGAHTGRNRLRRRRLHRTAAGTLAGRRLGRGFLLSVAELAALAHLPYDTDLPGLEAAAAQRVAPLPRVPTTGKLLGDADAGNPRAVALAVEDARAHVHVLGETGSGKSTLLAQMILADADAGRGVLAVDPKGDLINDILDRLPEAALDRLVLIDPDDPAPPPVLNVLDGPDVDLVADHAVGIMSRLFSAWWGPRTDDILRAAVLTLRDPSNAHRTDLLTLAAVPRLLTEDAFRRRATASIGDPVLGGFWSWYESLSDAARAQATGPVLNKLRAVLLRPFVRATLAAGPSTVDMAKILDGGICLVRLPKGSLGEDSSRLLGSFLLARVWQTATHRARTGQAARRDAAVYLDEAQNFLTLPHALDDMLAEARGYRLSMVLAHQHLSQLGPELQDGVSANARSKILFTCSPEDARRLERHVAPRLAAHDLAHLDGYQAAARLLVGNRRTPAFTLRTRPLAPAIPGRADAARTAAHTGTPAGAPAGATGPAGATTRPRTAQNPSRSRRTGTGARPNRTRP
jgi:Type IV secretion-system coupling protein DNA-binding domain